MVKLCISLRVNRAEGLDMRTVDLRLEGAGCLDFYASHIPDRGCACFFRDTYFDDKVQCASRKHIGHIMNESYC